MLIFRLSSDAFIPSVCLSLRLITDSMPARPGLAARRFYRTFYHWSLLHSDTPRTLGQHALHTTPQLREDQGEDQDDTKRPRARKPSASASRVKASQESNTASHQETSSESNQNNGVQGSNVRRRNGPLRLNASSSSPTSGSRSSVPASGSGLTAGVRRLVLDRHRDPSSVPTHRPSLFYLQSPVLSPSQKAFSSFDLRERVVRYRSPEGIMLEIAMPGELLHVAREKWGSELRGISQRSGARVEMQDISMPLKDRPDSRLHSVLISGTFDQVAKAEGLFSSVDTSLSGAVHSQDELSSESMSPWQIVPRSRKGDQIVAELRVLEQHWMSIVDKKDWVRFARSRAVALEVGPLESRSALANSPGDASARSLMMSGTAKTIIDFRSILAGEFGRVKDDNAARAAPTSAKGNASPREPEMRHTIVIMGKDALHPGFVDAVWASIQPAPPEIKVYRTNTTEDHPITEWIIQVLGPSSAARSVREQIAETVANVARRMELKNVRMDHSFVDTHKCTITVTGRDAMKIKEKAMANMLQSGVKERFGVAHSIDSKYTDSGRQWRERIKVKPEFLEPVRKLLLQSIREAGEQLGHSRFQAILTVDNAGVELPSAKMAKELRANRNTPGKTNNAVARPADVSKVDTQPAALKQKSLGDQKREAQAQRAKADQSLAESVPGEPLLNGGQKVKVRRPERTPAQQKQLTEDVRASLRSLTHPVVLVTSQVNAIGTQLSPEESARGVTVSSFNTVSLDPHSVISFNLKVPSRSWDAICQSRKLCVHLLQASSRGAAIAHVFTKPHDRPEMGFEQLRELGLQVQISQSLKAPIVSDEQGAVLARFEADLLPEKCVRVGDHVVVLAEVTSVTMHEKGNESSDGLAYAKKGYRESGKEVLPARLPTAIEGGPNDPLMLTVDKPAVAQSYAPMDNQVGGTKPSDPHASFNLDHDPIYNALRATKDAAESGEEIDIYAAMAMEDEGFGEEMWPKEGRHSLPDSASKPYTRRKSEDTSPKVNFSMGRSYSTLSSRAFSMLATPFAMRCGFSSTAAACRQRADDSHLLDDATKASTVADYLGLPDDNKRPHFPRVRSLVRFQKEIDAAKSRLENEELSEEEAADLQTSIAHQERIIARKLAWNAASDLRLMLDKGNARVDFKRAQWLESAVEKGLTVLLDDARRLRQKREEGKVDAEKYEMLRQKLESDHGVLQTELMRLRDVADEDQDGGD